MKSSKLTLGIVVVVMIGALGTGVVLENTKVQKLESENQILRTQNQDAQAQQEERDRAAKAQAANGQSEVGPNDHLELLKLRGEVAMLRRELQVASNRVATATAASANSQAQSIQIQQEMARLRTQEAQQRVVSVQAACINNLRQLDGAKAQWALENRKIDSSRVMPSDIAPYLKGGVLPVCPQGGVYSLTTVSANPTCSIPGHNL